MWSVGAISFTTAEYAPRAVIEGVKEKDLSDEPPKTTDPRFSRKSITGLLGCRLRAVADPHVRPHRGEIVRAGRDHDADRAGVFKAGVHPSASAFGVRVSSASDASGREAALLLAADPPSNSSSSSSDRARAASAAASDADDSFDR